MQMKNLKVITTSVIRASQKGESHGGIFLIDLISGSHELIMDWDSIDIDWSGCGMDRGLRGITFSSGCTFIAASDELLVFDKNFKIIDRWKNQYLKHCHEIFTEGDTLWLTSTGFDSILSFDLKRGLFVQGYCLWHGFLGSMHKKIFKHTSPKIFPFDPNKPNGPKLKDTLHLNNVFYLNGNLFLSGSRLGSLLCFNGTKIHPMAPIPFSTHNVQPYKDGVLMHYTKKDMLLYTDHKGRTILQWELPHYDEHKLINVNIPKDYARQRFGRGLCTSGEDLIIAGSSPATVTLYRLNEKNPVTSINLSKDVRNAIHGLEVYPY